METPDQEDQSAIERVARRHGFSVDAARTMLDAVVRGNGSMAQFNHPEFGGAGQWMRGGMTLVSDLFDNRLKAAVDGLCVDLASLAAERSVPARSGGGASFQSQRQGASDGNHSSPGFAGSSAEPGAGRQSVSAAGQWWPARFGMPSSSGAQNGQRYAYFSEPRRLVIERDGVLTVYDTETHRISGVSQQQSGAGTISFSSQHGPVDLSRLAVLVEPTAGNVAVAGRTSADSSAPRSHQPASVASSLDIPSLIEKLAALHAEGILSDAEFGDKKAELLRRI